MGGVLGCNRALRGSGPGESGPQVWKPTRLTYGLALMPEGVVFLAAVGAAGLLGAADVVVPAADEAS